jgi:hypothetical protein
MVDFLQPRGGHAEVRFLDYISAWNGVWKLVTVICKVCYLECDYRLQTAAEVASCNL